MANFGSTLLRRVLASGGLMLAVAGAFCADLFWRRDDLFLQVILSVVTFLAYWEFCDLCESWGVKVFRVLGAVGCVAMVWLHWLTLREIGVLPPEALEAGLVVFIFAVFLRQGLIHENRDALPAVAMTLLGVLYLWFLPGFLVKIRHLGGDGHWLSVGNGLLIGTIAVSKMSDVGAYLCGSLIGRTKLIPRISPAKTVEGSACGLLFSVGTAFACSALGLLGGVKGPALVVAFGLLVGLASQCGDLLESIFKRSGGLKDSGRLLPGYGGILDVLDSLLISAPPAYLFLWLVGGGGR